LKIADVAIHTYIPGILDILKEIKDYPADSWLKYVLEPYPSYHKHENLPRVLSYFNSKLTPEDKAKTTKSVLVIKVGQLKSINVRFIALENPKEMKEALYDYISYFDEERHSIFSDLKENLERVLPLLKGLVPAPYFGSLEELAQDLDLEEGYKEVHAAISKFRHSVSD